MSVMFVKQLKELRTIATTKNDTNVQETEVPLMPVKAESFR